MSDHNGMSCAEFGDSAAELALGVLTGRERAEALAHLDHCEACREHVRQLTTTGEKLLGLLPSAEPPAGFETRVMERIGIQVPVPQPQPIRHRNQPARSRAYSARRLLAAAAAVVAVGGAALGGWGLHAATAPTASSTLTSATLLAMDQDHDNVGQVFVYNGQPRWMYMSVDLESGNSTVICQLVSADGHVTTVGSFRLTDGYGSWGSPAWTGSGAPVGARLVSANGTVLATATFPKGSV